MTEWMQSSLFGITLTVFAYEWGILIQRKLKTPAANPLLTAVVLIILILHVFQIPIEIYQKGGDVISIFVAPATAALAVSIYSRLGVLKKHFLPIISGCLVGAITSLASIFLLCKVFGINETLTASLIPKSVTTPIAMEISSHLGGSVPVTVAAVMATGIMGAVLAPTLIRLLKIDDSVAAGVAIGASSHAVGTTKATELGETEGAMSGLAIGISGIITVIISMFL